MESDDRIWIKYSRQRAFPISAATSVVLHGTFLALVLLGVISLFASKKPEAVEFEPVIIAESPGGGMHGSDERSGGGDPARPPDASGIIENVRRGPMLKLPTDPIPVARVKPDPAEPAHDLDSSATIEQRLRDLRPVPSLKPLLKGLLDVPGTAAGIGRGSGQGTGTGPGTGAGEGAAGRLTQKQKRQLRWTLLYSIRDAADYIDQLARMKAIIGVQYPDRSIKLVTNLRQRPARLESGERVPDRIFWMDDNPDAVRSMANELAIDDVPWRVIAFFPPTLEDELLAKEKAFGKRFGRDNEDDIAETVFRVETRFGNIDISVVRQQGKR